MVGNYSSLDAGINSNDKPIQSNKGSGLFSSLFGALEPAINNIAKEVVSDVLPSLHLSGADSDKTVKPITNIILEGLSIIEKSIESLETSGLTVKEIPNLHATIKRTQSGGREEIDIQGQDATGKVHDYKIIKINGQPTIDLIIDGMTFHVDVNGRVTDDQGKVISASQLFSQGALSILALSDGTQILVNDANGDSNASVKIQKPQGQGDAIITIADGSAGDPPIIYSFNSTSSSLTIDGVVLAANVIINAFAYSLGADSTDSSSDEHSEGSSDRSDGLASAQAICDIVPSVVIDMWSNATPEAMLALQDQAQAYLAELIGSGFADDPGVAAAIMILDAAIDVSRSHQDQALEEVAA